MTLVERLLALATGVAADIKALFQSSWTTSVLAADAATSSTSYSAVAGVSFTAAANAKYEVEAFGAYQTAATTTGIGLALDIPSGSVIGMELTFTASTTLIGMQQLADATAAAVSTGVGTAGTNTPLAGKWIVSTGGTGGNVQLTFRSEVSSSAVTLKGGLFFLKYRKIG